MSQGKAMLERYLRSTATGDAMTSATDRDTFDEANLHDPAAMDEEELLAFEEWLAENESLLDEHFMPAEARAKVGRRIRTTIAFPGVPAGTTGTILEADDDLVTLPVQWNLPGRTRPLVDWFTKWEYEKYLEEMIG